ncbi:putative translational regulatory protein ArgL [Mangrovibacter phragmitis]
MNIHTYKVNFNSTSGFDHVRQKCPGSIRNTF